MVETAKWTIATGEGDPLAYAGDALLAAVRQAASTDWGTLTARRIDAAERLILRFDDKFGFLEYWASDDGPVSGARFVNRSPVAEQVVELPCCGCGIPLAVPDGHVLGKPDAVRLLLQFLAAGDLPLELADPPREFVQRVLPGMEGLLVPVAVLNAVSWEPL